MEPEANSHTHSKTLKVSHVYSTLLISVCRRKEIVFNVRRASWLVVIGRDTTTTTAPVAGAPGLVRALDGTLTTPA